MHKEWTSPVAKRFPIIGRNRTAAKIEDEQYDVGPNLRIVARGCEARSQHLLPATYLAGFSADQATLPRRKRMLWVGDLQTGRVFEAPAANVVKQRDVYTIRRLPTETPDRLMIERWWTGIEAPLAAAIEKMTRRARRIEAVVWLRTIVPFVASVLVRGSEFDEGFRLRTEHIAPLMRTVDSSIARAIDVHRLLASLIVAKWIVVQAPSGHEFIGNDRGWFPVEVGVAREIGIAVPLCRTTHVVVVPQEMREVMEWRDGTWRSTEEHYDASAAEAAATNETISAMARRFVIASSERLAHEALTVPRVAQPEMEPSAHGFPTGGPARLHELMWHRLISATQRRYSMLDTQLFEIDTEFISSGWHPIVRRGDPVLSTLPGDVALEGRRIAARFYTDEILPFKLPATLTYAVKYPVDSDM